MEVPDRELHEDVQEAVDMNGENSLEAPGTGSVQDIRNQRGEYFRIGLIALKLDEAVQERSSLAEYAEMDRRLSEVKEWFRGRLDLDEDGSCLLRLAIEKKAVDAAQLLLVHGADPDSKAPNDPETPLEFLLNRGPISAHSRFASRKLRPIFVLHYLASLRPANHLEVAWFDNDQQQRPHFTKVQADLSHLGTFEPFQERVSYSTAWLHVRRTCVSLFMIIRGKLTDKLRLLRFP